MLHLNKPIIMSTIIDHLAEILILLFLIVTFFQSGLDKLMDWSGNLNFIKEHFKKSPLKNVVPLLLGIVLIVEIVASIFMIIGVYQIIVHDAKEMALYGAALSALTLILLLIGQRLAKDYAGAMTLAVYFITAVFGVYLLSL